MTGNESLAEAQRTDLAAIVDKLSLDMHAVKGNLAANTAITLETATTVDGLKAILSTVDFKELVDTLAAVTAMKGGFKVLGWVERPAKWVAAIAGAAAAIWAMWHNWGK